MSSDMPLNRAMICNSLITRMLLLLAVMLLSGVLVISLGVLAFGTGLLEALLGWAVCTVAALIAHVGGEYPRGDFNFAARMAIQMMVRTLPPFLVALWGINFVQPPLETSLVFYILSFYLVGLFVDVQLHVWRLRASLSESEGTSV